MVSTVLEQWTTTTLVYLSQSVCCCLHHCITRVQAPSSSKCIRVQVKVQQRVTATTSQPFQLCNRGTALLFHEGFCQREDVLMGQGVAGV